MSADPLSQLLAITPSDSALLPFQSRAIWVGVTGNLAVIDAKATGPTVILNITVGWHPIQITKVMATGTTASGIVIGR